MQPHFLGKSKLMMHHSCHIAALLADESLEWPLPPDVTPKYLYRRSLYHLLRKCRQVDPSGIITYTWQVSAPTTTGWSDWKIVRIGLQGNAEACMVLSEAALYALFFVLHNGRLGEAIPAKGVSGGKPKACAGGHGHGHGLQFFSTMW